jgi:hypothetical protein
VRKRAAVMAGMTAGGLAVLGSATFPASTGCTTRQCAGGFETWPVANGHWTDDTQQFWVTGNLNDPWIPYGGEVLVSIDFPSDPTNPTRLPLNALAYVGVTGDGSGSPNVQPPTPHTSDTFYPTFAPASGELAVFDTWTPTSIAVKNATCADYVLYVVIQFPPSIPADGNDGAVSVGPGGGDAGVLESGVTDASVEAGPFDGAAASSNDGATPD